MKPKSRDSLAIEKPVARYANYFEIGYNAFEVILDFGQHCESGTEPQIYTRIVASPVCAKALLELLRTAIAEYEKTFGDLS